ncbi:E2F-associated phosphoprotein [Aplochiton taeniatus]
MDKQGDFDSYEIEEPSDEERAESSSEDELDVLLNGTPDQKRKLIREYLTGESESSSGDEFEKEMEAELNSTIKTMECTWGPASASPRGETSATNVTPTSTQGLPQPQLYDQIYFDSDSEEEDTPSSSTVRRRKQQAIPTNDELLYDPEEDDRDQAWVDAKRRRYCNNRRRTPGSIQSRGPQSQGLPSSDAVLNCPACMTTLCLDCQRHDKYRTQYRAMFVMNCRVNKEEILRYQTEKQNKQKNRKRRKGHTETTTTSKETPGPEPRGMDGEEVYYPVQCTECSTEVAVFDKDEVYHFFNILSSHC